MKVSKIAVILAIVGLALTGYFALSGTVRRSPTVSHDTLVVGTNTPFPPFEYRLGNEIVGIDIDIVRKVAKIKHKRLIIKDFQDFHALLPALADGKLDLVASGVSITPERKEVVDFSDYYFISSQSVVSLERKKIKISDVQDFKDLIVGYQDGTTSQSWVEKNLSGIAGKSFSDLKMGIQLLRTGAVDVIVLDKPAAEILVKRSGDFRIAGEIKTEEKYAFAAQKGDPKNIIPAMNKLIREIRETGEYQNIIDKWFGGAR